MSKKLLSSLVLFALLTSFLTACNGSASPTLSVDNQVATAVAATATAEANFANAVDEAVAATVVAMPPTPTAQPEPDAYEMSEEELAALIDEAVNEAVLATEASSTATTQATADGTMTEDELYEATAYVYDAEAAIYYAEELLALYDELYGAYADDMLDLFTAMEEDLDEMVSVLTDVEDLLALGAEAATAAIDQLNEAADNLATHAASAQSDRAELINQIKANLDARENSFANLAPTEIAGDLNGTLNQLHDYLDTVKLAFGDRKIDPTELQQIAQLGANAQASILANGGAQLQNIVPSIDGLTRQLSRGDWSGASRSLGDFEASLPSRPSRR